MGDDEGVLGVRGEVVAEVGGAGEVEKDGSRVLDGRGQDGVGRGLVEVNHRRIIANPTAVCQFALPSGRLLHGSGPTHTAGLAHDLRARAADRTRDRVRRRRSPAPVAACAPPVAGSVAASRAPPGSRAGPAGTPSGQARRAARAEGAGESGLSRLIGLHAFNAAGDAAVAISLAGTLFFQVPTGEARGQVALFLALTMLPFAIVAPLIGPFLDRFSHGRRWAIGSTMAIRAFLCWVLATAVATDSRWLFPAALGCPGGVQGVRRHARRRRTPTRPAEPDAGEGQRPGVDGGHHRRRRVGAARHPRVHGRAGVVAALRLRGVRDRDRLGDPAAHAGRLQRRRGHAGADAGRARPPAGDARQAAEDPDPGGVAFALRANCGPRWLSGFLTMFMAFLLRDNPIGDWKPEVLLGLVIGAAGLGNTLGITLGSVLKRIDPALTVVLALIADAVVVLVAALFYGLVPLIAIGLTAGLAQSLAKLSLDSTIQRDVPERIQASAFARSDTTLQLAWVIGGFVGIAMPLMPRLGLGIACGVLAAWAIYVFVSAAEPDGQVTRRSVRLRARARRPARAAAWPSALAVLGSGRGRAR